MALPPLTMQASSTSQLQTTPIFSLKASTSALKDSKRRIHLPYASSCCGLPVLANRALSHNAACETTLALKLFGQSRGCVKSLHPSAGGYPTRVGAAYAVGSSIQPSGPKNSSGRK